MAQLSISKGNLSGESRLASLSIYGRVCEAERNTPLRIRLQPWCVALRFTHPTGIGESQTGQPFPGEFDSGSQMFSCSTRRVNRRQSVVFSTGASRRGMLFCQKTGDSDPTAGKQQDRP